MRQIEKIRLVAKILKDKLPPNTTIEETVNIAFTIVEALDPPVKKVEIK